MRAVNEAAGAIGGVICDPAPVQPVQAGGRQLSPSSATLQNFTVGESARAGAGGTGSTPQGGCGPDCAHANA